VQQFQQSFDTSKLLLSLYNSSFLYIEVWKIRWRSVSTSKESLLKL